MQFEGAFPDNLSCCPVACGQCNAVGSAAISQIYGDIEPGLNDLKKACPNYFKSAGPEPSQAEKACGRILGMLSKGEAKLLSITDFAAAEFARVSVVLIADKNVYYARVVGGDSFVAARSANEGFLSRVRSGISKIENKDAKIGSLRKNGNMTVAVLYRNGSPSDIFASDASPFTAFSEGDERALMELRRDALAYLGLDVLGQGVADSNYRLLAEELNGRVSKYFKRNEILLIRNMHSPHTLDELLYYCATSKEEIAPLMYICVLNINGMLREDKLFSGHMSPSEAEMGELKKI